MKRIVLTILFACVSILGLYSQSEFCLDGTVWNEQQGGCVPEVFVCGFDSDLDGDGSVGSSDLLQLLSEFGYLVPDADADGLCDEVDDCIGAYDECGVCNGPGPTTVVIEEIIIYLDSIFVEQIDEWLVFQVGADTLITYTCEPPFEGCGNAMSYQGYDYETVLIGDQCWFAENLRTECYSNGDSILHALDNEEWSATQSGAVTVYGEGDGYCEGFQTGYNVSGEVFSACDEVQTLSVYGRLYNWYAVIDERGLCPSGWHVPSNSEWSVMTDYVGSDVGYDYRAPFGWLGNAGGGNSSGFSALPGGLRFSSGAWGTEAIAIGFNGFPPISGHWWTSSPDDSNAWSRVINYLNGHDEMIDATDSQRRGLSVRCVQDPE